MIAQPVSGCDAAQTATTMIGQLAPGHGEQPPEGVFGVLGQLADLAPRGDQDGLVDIRSVRSGVGAAGQIGQHPGPGAPGDILEKPLRRGLGRFHRAGHRGQSALASRYCFTTV